MNVGSRKTLASFVLMLVASAEDSGAPPWQESFTARLEALVVLQTLNAELPSHDSATLTLDRWCAAHRLASPARIVAERVDGAYLAPTDEQRQLLGVNATEPIRYRRVRLICGGHVLSEADNPKSGSWLGLSACDVSGTTEDCGSGGVESNGRYELPAVQVMSQ